MSSTKPEWIEAGAKAAYTQMPGWYVQKQGWPDLIDAVAAVIAEVEGKIREQCASEVRECRDDTAPDSDAWYRLNEAADYITRGGRP